MSQRKCFFACFAAVSILTASAAGAKGHLQAQPTLIELRVKAMAGRLVLGNTGDEPVSAQVRVYAWSQQEGEDRMDPTDQIALSPPIAEIPPGGEQVVRLVRTGAPLAAGRDQTYRVIAEELPETNVDPNTAVKIQMRYIIPMYVRTAGATPPALTCRLKTDGLWCANNGGQTARLSGSRLLDDESHVLELGAGLWGYVLPGSERKWPLKAADLAPLGKGLRLETLVNEGSLSIPVAKML